MGIGGDFLGCVFHLLLLHGGVLVLDLRLRVALQPLLIRDGRVRLLHGLRLRLRLVGGLVLLRDTENWNQSEQDSQTACEKAGRDRNDGRSALTRTGLPLQVRTHTRT